MTLLAYFLHLPTPYYYSVLTAADKNIMNPLARSAMLCALLHWYHIRAAKVFRLWILHRADRIHL